MIGTITGKVSSGIVRNRIATKFRSQVFVAIASADVGMAYRGYDITT